MSVKRASVEGVGLFITGPEQDYVEFFSQPSLKNDRRLGVVTTGMCDLAEQADGIVVDCSYASAFRYGQHKSKDLEATRADYRENEGEGRQYPPLYRIKIDIQLEPISDQEAAVFWKKKSEEYPPPRGR
jgi:hypothetical protein